MDPRGGELPPLPSASHKPVRATPQVLWVSGRSMREGWWGGDKFVCHHSVVAGTPTLDPSPQGGGCRLVDGVLPSAYPSQVTGLPAGLTRGSGATSAMR